jgi:hypothetical protein
LFGPLATCVGVARRPRSISNFGGLCQTRKTPTLTPRQSVPNIFRHVITLINCTNFVKPMIINFTAVFQ